MEKVFPIDILYMYNRVYIIQETIVKVINHAIQKKGRSNFLPNLETVAIQGKLNMEWRILGA